MVCVGLCEQRPFAPLLSFCCAAPVIGGLTPGTLGMIADTVATIFRGKSVEEHAVGWCSARTAI
jgi:hypothetical protein